MKNKKILITSLIILVILIFICTIIIFLNINKDKLVPTAEELKTTELQAKDVVSISKIERYASQDSSKNDESVYLVKDEAMLTLRNSSVSKYGDTTNLNNTKNLGQNAALVTSYNSISQIYNSNITTDGEGASGIYGHGQKSSVEIADTSIETLGSSSSAIIAAFHSQINGRNLTINTKSKSSPALETITEDSSITIEDSTIETNSSASPIIYAQGTLTLKNTTGTANGSRIAILKGNANVTLNQVTSIVSGGSGEENFKESGILIYGNESDHATFTALNSSLNINQSLPYYNIAPLFIISNTKATINLTNTPLNYGSNIFINITSSKVNINLKKQTIEGDIIGDAKTKLKLTLKDNSSLNSIIPSNTDLSLDKTSSITLKQDTYLNSLNNDDETNSNINFNNYKLFVNGHEV